MTKRQIKGEPTELEAIRSGDDDFLRKAVRAAIQTALEAEMTEALAAERGERADVPRDRFGLFSTELFERYQRSERALVSALAEMYILGVSTRKMKAVTEQLCGHSFSALLVSDMNRTLDAALTAIAVDGEGHRQVLAADLANRESASSWRDFLPGLKQRALHGVEFMVSDNHPGLKQAIREAPPETAWQRCYVHFLRNALVHLPRRANDDCLQELRWIYGRRELAEVRRNLAAWMCILENLREHKKQQMQVAA
jgi:putative transposase